MSIPSPTQPAGRRVRRRPPAEYLSDCRGQTVIEYALIASLVAVAIFGALTQFAGSTNKLYNKISNAMVASP